MTSKAEEEFEQQLSLTGSPAWEREYRFYYPRRWRFDFAFVASNVAAEIEGGTWIKGRHTRGAGFERDCEKYNTAALMGWTVFRFTPAMVRSGEALNIIEQALAAIGAPVNEA